MIKEIVISNPITHEGEPDGSTVAIVDPYNGCTMGCPYCFRLSIDGWENNIVVNINIAELLVNRLKTWQKSETIYIGSLCDPYMSIEKDYELTRKCLIALDRWQIPTMITTKADNDLIFRDIDIIKNFSADITVLMGISNIRQLKKAYLGINNHNIEVSNKLHKMGIKVWAFITPFLPYIVPAEQMINALDKDIPVFLDLLRVEKGSIQASHIKQFIKVEYPELVEKYDDIIDHNNLDYYNKLIELYSGDDRIRFLPYLTDQD
jgi:DNA repair photolyase